MHKFLFVFVCVAALEAAYALQCYSCRGSDCEKETKTWEKVTCGTSGVQPYAGHEYACVKLTYKDRVGQKEMVSRKCVQAKRNGNKLDFTCPTTDGDPLSCPVCQSDLCNSAQTVKFSVLSTVLLLAVSLYNFL